MELLLPLEPPKSQLVFDPQLPSPGPAVLTGPLPPAGDHFPAWSPGAAGRGHRGWQQPVGQARPRGSLFRDSLRKPLWGVVSCDGGSSGTLTMESHQPQSKSPFTTTSLTSLSLGFLILQIRRVNSVRSPRGAAPMHLAPIRC